MIPAQIISGFNSALQVATQLIGLARVAGVSYPPEVDTAFNDAQTAASQLQAFVNGSSTGDPVALAQTVSAGLALLQSQGLLSGSAIDQSAQALSTFAAFVKNVQGGQVGIIKGGASLFGVRGAYAFIPAASDQGKSLGLS